MITNLRLQNFKAWADSGNVKFGPITAFFGSNSSGKTSFLQSMLLLKQTAESADRGRVFDLDGTASLVSLGTFNDITFQHDAERTVGIDIGWHESEAFEIRSTETKRRNTVAASHDLSLSVAVREIRNFPVVQQVEYGLGDLRFSLTRNRGSKDEYALDSNDYPFKRVSGRPWPLPSPGKFYSFPDQVRAYYQNAAFLSDLELQFEKLCSRIYYLGPLRQDPARQYIWSGGRPVDVGRRGELAVEALIASQADGKTNARGFAMRKDGPRRRTKLITVEEHVASWLQELGLIHSFAVESVDDRRTLYRVQVKRSPGSTPVLLTDVGFGVSQVLPVLVLLAYAPEGSTVLLEQPEIHLHPAVQSALADVVIEAAKVRNIQVVVESHSEHFLMRLQRRIAERDIGRGTTLEPEDCLLYFCATEGPASTISRLTLDLFGNITNWPDDFFGNQFGEAAAMNRAARRRVIEEQTA